MFLPLLFLLQLSRLALASSTTQLPQTKPGCEAKCGNITIPYPFGIGPRENECSLTGDRSLLYNITCDTSLNPPKPFLSLGTDKFSGKYNIIELLSISDTEVRVKTVLATLCYDYKTGNETLEESMVFISVAKTPFTISSTKNSLFGIGCESYASITANNLNAFTRCNTNCETRENVIDGSCSGNGCCQTPLFKGIKDFDYMIDGPLNTTSETISFSPCSYAFIGESDQYSFSALDFGGSSFGTRERNVPVVLDWAIGGKTCEEAQKDLSTFACQKYSNCSNSDNVPGYFCTCITGFAGNPYLSTGCE
ncbi:hypothetical protein MKW94_014714, partial [Papaver nudicaule]|nr:hypothetical protein [Papaver nudicaule]